MKCSEVLTDSGYWAIITVIVSYSPERVWGSVAGRNSSKYSQDMITLKIKRGKANIAGGSEGGGSELGESQGGADGGGSEGGGGKGWRGREGS